MSREADMSMVTTHLLDTSLGQPASGVPVRPGPPRRSSPDPLAPAYPEV
jgi:5-hydroxyisourate hydrolase-like protein (transthyretin family)